MNALALLPLGVGLLFTGVGATMLRRSRLLRTRGATAHGRVVRLHESAGRAGTLYHPVVVWELPDGGRAEATAAVGKSWIGHYRPGTRVTVFYDPADPARMVIDGYSRAVEWVLLLLGAATIAVTVMVVDVT
ncbi:DUF3592 domain-containing protein [Nocardia thailandica]